LKICTSASDITYFKTVLILYSFFKSRWQLNQQNECYSTQLTQTLLTNTMYSCKIIVLLTMEATSQQSSTSKVQQGATFQHVILLKHCQFINRLYLQGTSNNCPGVCKQAVLKELQPSRTKTCEYYIQNIAPPLSINFSFLIKLPTLRYQGFFKLNISF